MLQEGTNESLTVLTAIAVSVTLIVNSTGNDSVVIEVNVTRVLYFFRYSYYRNNTAHPPNSICVRLRAIPGPVL